MTKRLGAWDFGYERTLDRVTLREGEKMPEFLEGA